MGTEEEEEEEEEAGEEEERSIPELAIRLISFPAIPPVLPLNPDPDVMQ